MTSLSPSELIINSDGSIYHLNLLPNDVANTIITVGDPDRVAMVSKHFDTIEVKRQHREFVTHTGFYFGKRLSVLSTGIGTGNIDIVLNELDALVNIDFNTRMVKNNKTALQIIRLGTSGAIQPNISIDSFILSNLALGFDNLLHFYGNTASILNEVFSENFTKHCNWNPNNSKPYAVGADPALLSLFKSQKTVEGITTTNIGFYGPQGRVLRLPLEDPFLNKKIASFQYNGKKITNLEMETAAIYGLAKLLGHKAISLNAILANRVTGEFSIHPKKTIEKLILYTLQTLVS